MAPENLTGLIRIVKTPVGEAPLPVREAWVGCELACYPVAGYFGIMGALSQDPQGNRYGFCMPQDVAITTLRKQASFAALWWNNHGYPKKGEYFVFGFDEAEIISGVEIRPIIRVDDDMQGDPFR